MAKVKKQKALLIQMFLSKSKLKKLSVIDPSSWFHVMKKVDHFLNNYQILLVDFLPVIS